MFSQREIEEIILGMAEIVYENRALRNENKELSLSREKYKALAHGNHKEYEILNDIEGHNLSVSSCRLNGLWTNEDYIDDWRLELKKRMGENGK